jgi:hypothetical protein
MKKTITLIKNKEDAARVDGQATVNGAGATVGRLTNSEINEQAKSADALFILSLQLKINPHQNFFHESYH